MGFAISRVAFKGKSAPEIRELLSLAPTGRFEEVPEGVFSAAALSDGWYVLVINRHAHEFISEETLKQVSSGCDVVAVTVAEHAMFSSAEGWTNGSKLWWLVHSNPEVDHVFDVPLEPAESITGFKHDKSINVDFEILEKTTDRLTSNGLRLFGMVSYSRSDGTRFAGVPDSVTRRRPAGPP
jgi:hypothetical protein